MASYVDHFTEASDTNLTAHTPDSGGSWSEVEDSAGTLVGAIRSSIDAARAQASTTASARLLYTVSWTPAAATYDVSYKYINVATTTDDPIGVLARYTSTSSYYASAQYLDTAATDVKIMRVTAGPTRDVLASGDTAPAINDVFKLSLLTASKKFYKNGAEILSSSDNTITDVGVCGLAWGNYTNVSTDDVNTGINVDDFTLDDTSDPGGGASAKTLAALGVG